MAEFDDLRSQLAQHRAEGESARGESLLAAEAARRIERRLADAARASDPDGETLAALREEHAAARRHLEQTRGKASAAERTGRQLAEAIATFTDPVKGIERLPDLHPILLFPLRLETRFKPSPTGTPQLWVRVYPDICLVDGFEESLTDAEVENGTAFWAAVWRAGGDEAMERAAWRELVAACGAGRAAWVVRQLVPLNPGDRPVRYDARDILLVITSPTALPAAATDYWVAVWRAQGEPVASQQALDNLTAAVGATQAAEIAQQNKPVNYDDLPAPPDTPATVRVAAAVLQLPTAADLETRRSSWSSAPRVDVLPERFVLLGWEGAGPPQTHLGAPIPDRLIAGPDPNAEPAQQLKPVGDTLQIPDDLAWMFDFERALDVGMAFRIDLSPSQADRGFDRLMVLGVRLTDTPAEGRAGLERLLEHHLYSRQGLELLRQGTPTNDTEQAGSGYTWRDDPESTFEPFFRQVPQFDHETDPLLRRDGQRLAEGLGVSEGLASRIPGAGLADRLEAHAMQIALWPSTLGYLMDTLMRPVFPDSVVAATREFFTRHVSGRGPLPALRIGDQPYGILPTVEFSRLGWFGAGDRRVADVAFPAQLYSVVRRMEADWRPLVGIVSRLGGTGGDPHQVLLDVLGLHPTSAEYYPLGAAGLEHKTHELSLYSAALVARLMALFPPEAPLDLLRRFGYAGDEVPDILTKIYRARQKPLDGPLVDDRPLSESDPIRAYASGRNYVQWLVDSATAGIAALQREEGFDDGKRPAALLYLMLRHALQLSFRETGLVLKAEAGLALDPVVRREPAFVHVAAAARASESRYAELFSPDVAVTGRDDLLLGDYIARHLRTVTGPMPEHIAALERLSGLPTARLERLFAEHVDTVSYRLDAWKSGLLSWGLEQLRAAEGQEPPGLMEGPAGSRSVPARGAADGTYLGAYGWLEDLRPEDKNLSPATVDADVAEKVNEHDSRPLLHDPTNLGLVHAPSINHAATAAVLRNGHVAHQGRLSVNLSSRRVRTALAVLEGMRGGQSLGALLGYQLERHVHDHGPLQVRALVYPLRRAFPLVANQIASTATGEGEAQESIAAMNVVDGRKLLEHLDRTEETVYPFGVASLPRRPAPEEAAVTAAVAHIRDVNDAVADLALSEGVYQAVMGNYDRSAGTLDAFAKGSYPPEPEVIRTPRSGTALTLRTAIHLPVTGTANPLPTMPMTPLAAAEPAVNRWLKDRLPAPGDVGCRVVFTDRTTDVERQVLITQEDLGLHPIDLLYRAQTRADQALGDLDERILERLHATETPRHDQPIVIRHTERVPGRVTWFELEALLRSLRRVVLAARPLRPADLQRHGDARRDEQATSTLPRGRADDARVELRDVLIPALDLLATTIADPTVTIDDVVDAFAATVSQLAAYRIPQAGTGFAYEARARAYVALLERVGARVQTWTERLDRHDELLGEYAALPGSATAEERLQILRTAEVLVSTTVTDGLTPDDHFDALGLKRDAFVAKRGQLEELVDTPRPTLAQLLDDAEALLPVGKIDAEPFDFAPDRNGIDRLRADLAGRVAQLKEEAGRRVTAAGNALSRHDAAPLGNRAELVQEAARALFGEDFVLVPQITLPAAAAAELGNAWSHSTSGALTKHLTDPPPTGSDRDFPVDDWLHGVARVRDKMHHWENVSLLTDALPGASPPDLTPLQLPHQLGAPWLALELPAGTMVDSDRLLYTAAFAQPFDPSRPVCGLLIDEWTEVIPARQQTTGVAFHHDRPNAEPPQAWLLALPAIVDGQWSWDELVGAVTDALDSAKMRTIEPTHVDRTAYSAFLPATHSAWTFPEISISNNLLRNVQIYALLAQED